MDGVSRRGGPGRRSGAAARGTTLPELLIALTVTGLLGALAVSGMRHLRGTLILHGAAAAVTHELALARRLAVSRRETVRLRLGATGEVLLLDGRDSVLWRAPVGLEGTLRVDSVRIRPSVMRFNARGQAAPGSVYLYRDGRGVRVVCNFLGRLRRETVR